MWGYEPNYFLARNSEFLGSCRHGEVTRQPAEAAAGHCIPPTDTVHITSLPTQTAVLPFVFIIKSKNAMC